MNPRLSDSDPLIGLQLITLQTNTFLLKISLTFHTRLWKFVASAGFLLFRLKMGSQLAFECVCRHIG